MTSHGGAAGSAPESAGPNDALPNDAWIVTDGRIGMTNQCVGLAEALDLSPTVLTVRAAPPRRWLPPQLWWRPLTALEAPGAAPPWPDLVIATGRQSVAPALAIRQKAAGRTRLVQIQNPTVDPARFDLIVTPQHDRLEAPNVLSTVGSLHRINMALVEAEAARLAARYRHLPRPLVAVLIGGTNRAFRLDATAGRQLGAALAELAAAQGVGLAVTTSRRTDPEALAALRAALADVPADLYAGDGDNPYFAMLGLADAVVATCDSVNMVSEALATAKPVHIYELPGGSAKFRRFLDGLYGAGLARKFAGRLERWTYTPPDDMARAVAAVRALF